jgi:hypothetical protein
MSTKAPNKNTALVIDTKVIEAVDKYLAKVTSLTVAGTSYTPTSLKAVLQTEIDAIKALDSMRAQVKQQVAATGEARVSARVLRKGLRQYILGNYGEKALSMLDDFGMAPKAKSTPTVHAKAEAVDKALATREARHTMGKKQRQLITVAPQPATTATPSQGSEPATPAPNATPPKS